jgi:hypothetical protein
MKMYKTPFLQENLDRRPLEELDEADVDSSGDDEDKFSSPVPPADHEPESKLHPPPANVSTLPESSKKAEAPKAVSYRKEFFHSLSREKKLSICPNCLIIFWQFLSCNS